MDFNLFPEKKQSNFPFGMSSNADVEFAWSQWATLKFFAPLYVIY